VNQIGNLRVGEVVANANERGKGRQNALAMIAVADGAVRLVRFRAAVFRSLR